MLDIKCEEKQTKINSKRYMTVSEAISRPSTAQGPYYGSGNHGGMACLPSHSASTQVRSAGKGRKSFRLVTSWLPQTSQYCSHFLLVAGCPLALGL